MDEEGTTVAVPAFLAGAESALVRPASEDDFATEDVEGGEEDVVLRGNELGRPGLFDLFDGLCTVVEKVVSLLFARNELPARREGSRRSEGLSIPVHAWRSRLPIDRRWRRER